MTVWNESGCDTDVASKRFGMVIGAEGHPG